MSVRPFVLAAASFLALALAAPAHAVDVAVGDLRTPTNRGGAALRSEPRVSATVLGLVKHGTRFHVAEVRELWIRVEADVAAGEKHTGWLRASETVQPYALTGEGRSPGVAGGTGAREQAQASAAGRGFSEDAEQQLMQSQAELRAAYALVDARVEAIKPSPEEVAAFAKQGRLGIPGKTR